MNAATTYPFGLVTGCADTSVRTGYVAINAPVTSNSGVWVSKSFHLTGKITLRPSDSLHVMNGAVINGTFNSSNYFATGYNSSTGAQSLVQYDGLATPVTIPVGTVNY